MLFMDGIETTQNSVIMKLLKFHKLSDSNEKKESAKDKMKRKCKNFSLRRVDRNVKHFLYLFFAKKKIETNHPTFHLNSIYWIENKSKKEFRNEK